MKKYSFYEKKGSIFTMDEKGTEERVCGSITVKRKLLDNKTNKKLYQLEYNDEMVGKHVFTSSLNNFNAKLIEETFQMNGIEVEHKYCSDLSNYLQKRFISIPVQGISSERVGFDDGLENFYIDKRISMNKENEDVTVVQSEKFGPYIKSSGKEIEYIKMLNDCVHNPELQLALSFGFAAPLATYLSKDLDLGVLIVGLSGKTTTGKSTALQLMLSPFVNPNFQQNGFALKAKSTRLALELLLGDNYGIPVALDDVSAFIKEEKSDFIMSLETGESRGHSNQCYEMLETKKWRGLIGLNSEKTILDDNGLEGAEMRLLTFDNIKWTLSAEQSEKIKICISNNYGFFTEKYIKILRNYQKSQLVNIVNEWKIKFEKDIKESGLEPCSRVLNKLAVIMTASEMINYVFENKYSINVNLIYKLMLDEEIKRTKRRNIVDSTINELNKFLIKNKEKFYTVDNETIFWDNCYGMVTGNNPKTLYLLEEGFDEFLKENSLIPQKKLIVSKLIESNYMEKDKNQIKQRKTIMGVTKRVYKLYLQ